jgi:hypothetical protein
MGQPTHLWVWQFQNKRNNISRGCVNFISQNIQEIVLRYDLLKPLHSLISWFIFYFVVIVIQSNLTNPLIYL